MRLSLYTDYAFRVLLYLSSQDDRVCSVAEIAHFHGISRHHLAKVVHALGKAGLIEPTRGRRGGFRLALPPERIGLGTTVRLTEKQLAMVGSRRYTEKSLGILRNIQNDAVNAFMAVLDRYSLADLIIRRA